MRRNILGALVMSLMTLSVLAESVDKKNLVMGRVIDGDDQSPVSHATVQILTPADSVMVVGNVTDLDGKFALAIQPGKYLLKISYVGYSSKYEKLQVSVNRKKLDMGILPLSPDAIMLGEAVITAQAPEVKVSGDTLVYNSSAYRVPQGSALEELVKKLPGAEVDENGKITINGKEVKKIMVGGKEFFADDPKVAMKNLPVNIVDRIRAYDKESDMARMTGIKDGEEETVLDLTLKPGMNNGWFGNVDLAAATEDRYSGKFMLNRFNDNNQFTVIGSANNVNDESYPGGGGRHGRGMDGLNAIKTAGFNFATERSKWETGGSVNFDYNDADLQSKSNSETFISSKNSSFKNAFKASRNKSNALAADFRIEWKPDTNTTFILRPRFDYGNIDNSSMLRSFTFNQASNFSIDELIEAHENGQLTTMVPEENIVNTIRQNNLTDGDNINAGASLMANRRLGKKGRNITLHLKYNYTDNDQTQYYMSETEYYQKLAEGKNEVLNRYITTPVSDYNYFVKLAYSEPIFKGGFLQFAYSFRNKVSETDNSTFTMPDDWTIAQGFLPGEAILDKDLSKYAKYKYFNHTAEASFKWMTQKHQLNVGVSFQPQHSVLSYEKGDYSVETVRNVLNVTPTLDYRRMFSRTSQLRIMYRGYSGQPNMIDLLPISDDTDPLNVRVGNPGLKPSFTNYLMAYYNSFKPKAQRNVMFHFMYRNTLNAISRRRVYDENTGGYISHPENINGNWNTSGMFGLNTPLKNKNFTISSFTMSRFNNMVSYISNVKDYAEADKNKTKQLTLSERFRGTYRNNWFEFSLLGSIYYTHSRNSLQSSSNMDTYQFSYGGSTNVNLPWNMSISTDLSQSSRRGYADSEMNNNELVWNAQISQNFLKKNAATISLQFYDILRNKSNISRSITAAMRQDTEYNSIFSYCMIHFIYRLDLFGGKGGRQQMYEGHKNYGRGSYGKGGYGRGGYGGGYGHRRF